MTLTTLSIICRLFSPSSLIHRYSRTLTYMYRVNHFSHRYAQEGGKLLLIQWVTILYHHVPLRCHSHHHHLSDDEDQGVLKIVYYAVSLSSNPNFLWFLGSWGHQEAFPTVSTRLGAWGAKISALGRVRAGGRNSAHWDPDNLSYALDNLPA